MNGIIRILAMLWRYAVVPVLVAVFAMPPHGRCRFVPHCSHYATEAWRIHGIWRALPMILRRIARCHPWGGSGYDPVSPACPASHGDVGHAPVSPACHDSVGHDSVGHGDVTSCASSGYASSGKKRHDG